jgi:hypothetical protein
VDVGGQLPGQVDRVQHAEIDAYPFEERAISGWGWSTSIWLKLTAFSPSS